MMVADNGDMSKVRFRAKLRRKWRGTFSWVGSMKMPTILRVNESSGCSRSYTMEAMQARHSCTFKLAVSFSTLRKTKVALMSLNYTYLSHLG